MKTMGLMEHLFRINDQLDEQLHAGFYFYILTSKTTFVSNSTFVYPIVVILWAYFFYNTLQYFEFKTNEMKDDDIYLNSAFVFLLGSSALGFVTMITPSLYLEFLGNAKNYRSEFCLAKNTIADQVT
jgi:Gaa1-like, GPI transamidase component